MNQESWDAAYRDACAEQRDKWALHHKQKAAEEMYKALSDIREIAGNYGGVAWHHVYRIASEARDKAEGK